MNTIIKKGFKLIMTHLLSLALTFFLLLVLGWVVTKWGFIPFSVIALIFYVALFYSDGWNWGRIEGRKYNDIKENPLRALAATVIPSIIPIVFILLTLFGYSHYLLGVIEKVWYFPFVGILGQDSFLSVSKILISGAVIPVVVTFGYFVGTKDFSVLEKIAFRKNRQKEAERKAQMNK